MSNSTTHILETLGESKCGSHQVTTQQEIVLAEVEQKNADNKNPIEKSVHDTTSQPQQQLSPGLKVAPAISALKHCLNGQAVLDKQPK